MAGVLVVPIIVEALEAAAAAAAAVLAAIGVGAGVEHIIQSTKSSDDVDKTFGDNSPGAVQGCPELAASQSKPKATFGEQSQKHAEDRGHVGDGEPQMEDSRSGKLKSKHNPGEGGQDFTDDVLNHPDTEAYQQGGRRVYENEDLGRVTGKGQNGEDVRGGKVVVEGDDPSPNSRYQPGEVVTQHPWAPSE